ncbi:MAG: alpha/beta hydrolase [Paracoccaceae bacterium]
MPPGGRAYWATVPDAIRVRFAVWRGGGAGTALMLPGRTEFVEKYGPTAARLLERGFSVVAIDWRGQGLSDRDGGYRAPGHVNDFKEYQYDLQAILASTAVTGLPQPHYLFGHSMGGCIGLRGLVAGLKVKGAVFSAPMWALPISGVDLLRARLIHAFARMTGHTRRLAPGQDAGPYVLQDRFEDNVLTGDAAAFRWFQETVRAHPELGLGGPSIGWIGAALRETRALGAAAPPSLPVLTFLGSDETVVSPDAIRRQVARMPRGELVEVDGARHEIWMEREEVQAGVWRRIDRFLGVP